MTQEVDVVKNQKEQARNQLVKYANRAVEVLIDLMEDPNARVRLAAAESVLDRSGVGKSQTHDVQVSQVEHDQAKQEAEKLFADLQKAHNKGLPVPTPELDTIMVLEGDTEELPIADPIDQHKIIEVKSQPVEE